MEDSVSAAGADGAAGAVDAAAFAASGETGTDDVIVSTTDLLFSDV
jgi:hypothetical protein